MPHSAAPRFLLSVAAAALLAFAADPAHAQSAEAPLRIEVAIEGKPQLTGELEISAVVTNTSRRDLELPANLGWDREGGLVIEITEVNARTQTLPLDADDSMRSTVRAEGKSVLTLLAGHGTALSRTVSIKEVMPTPGTYRVVVAYLGLGDQRIVSEPVEFVVPE